MPEGGGALSARAGRVVALVGAALASVWAAFLLRDVAGVASDRPSALTLAAGLGLLDWVRWILLSLVVASAAHAAGRAGGPAERRLMRVAVAAAAHLVGAVGLIRNSVLDGLGPRAQTAPLWPSTCSSSGPRPCRWWSRWQTCAVARMVGPAGGRPLP